MSSRMTAAHVFIWLAALVSAGFTITAEAKGLHVLSRKPASAVSDLTLPELVTELKGAARDGVRVGDRLELAIRLPEGSTTNVAGALWTAVALPGGFPLKDLGWEVRTVEIDAKNPGELRVRAYPVKAGMLELPPLQISDADGRAIGKTQPMKIPVRSGIEEPAPNASGPPEQPEPAPLRPPVHLQKPFLLRFGPILLEAFLAIMLIAGVVLIFKKTGRKKAQAQAAPIETAPVRSAEKEAIEALKRLDQKDWIVLKEFSKHYYAASRVLRRFLGEVYGFDAEESTTLEVLNQLSRSSDLSSEKMARLRELLSEMDRVKYAKDAPDSGLAQSLTQRLSAWISREEGPHAF